MDTRIYSNQMIESMRKHLETRKSKYITYPKFIFICGKEFKKDEYWNSNRGILEQYIKKENQDLCIVLSEQLWEDNFDSNIDLLTFEEFLAEVSDCIIVIVESPGTFAELGAFSYAYELFSEKLILIIDNKYKNEKSFIMTGPVNKAKKNGSSVLFTSLGNGLLSSRELRNSLLERIKDFKKHTSAANRRIVNQDNNGVLLNSFIIELLELIRIIQPVSKTDLLTFYKMVKGFEGFSFIKKNGTKFNQEIKYDYILKLLKTVGLINEKDGVITSDVYKKTKSLMMNYARNAEYKERNKLLCRKYRYKEKFDE